MTGRSIGYVTTLHPRRDQIALALNKTTEVAQGRRRIGMLGTEHLFSDREGAFVEWPRGGKITLA